MKNKDLYLENLETIILDLENSLDQVDPEKFLSLCALLQEFRDVNGETPVDKIADTDRAKVAVLLTRIDTVIEKIENNKQLLATKIFTLRKSIEISRNQEQ
jgi:hypothetical protein